MSRFACLGRTENIRLGYKTVADFVKFKSMFPAVLMTVSLVERALLLKLFTNTRGMLLLQFVNFVIERTYGVALCLLKVSGQGLRDGEIRSCTWKSITPVLVNAVKTAVDAQSDIRIWTRSVSRQTGVRTPLGSTMDTKINLR
ncbi:hypothetical protein TNCV_3698811 [Trichonephila clavipes]|uniref:Uncharacterized protein n=1 Tax=Trichonephila clavipes TaxID=2585209 RepID=A0A8X6VEQ9_TRICX|nr:hypothetical protein TNCV_3698811 [Trichonephila clavipes]